jgi:hypothetical protein
MAGVKVRKVITSLVTVRDSPVAKGGVERAEVG